MPSVRDSIPERVVPTLRDRSDRRFLRRRARRRAGGRLTRRVLTRRVLARRAADSPDFKLGAEVLFQKVPDDPDAPWYKGMYLGESKDPNLPEHLVIDPCDGEPVEELPRARVKAEAHVTGV